MKQNLKDTQEAAAKAAGKWQKHLLHAEAAVQLALEKAECSKKQNLEAAAEEEYKAIAAEVKADAAKKSRLYV